MKTASHYGHLGAGRICISLGNPRGAPAGYRIYRKLAPTRAILSINDEAEYERAYRSQILDRLDPKATWLELHKLAAGAEPVFQCFEKPPFNDDNWCHRRMVARWFFDTLGENVPEIDYEAGSFTPDGSYQDSSYQTASLGQRLLRVAKVVQRGVTAMLRWAYEAASEEATQDVALYGKRFK